MAMEIIKTNITALFSFTIEFQEYYTLLLEKNENTWTQFMQIPEGKIMQNIHELPVNILGAKNCSSEHLSNSNFLTSCFNQQYIYQSGNRFSQPVLLYK